MSRKEGRGLTPLLHFNLAARVILQDGRHLVLATTQKVIRDVAAGALLEAGTAESPLSYVRLRALFVGRVDVAQK